MHDAPHHALAKAPGANPRGLSLGARDLSLVRASALDTSPRSIIEDTFQLIKSRPNETIGYGVALFALNSGLNFALQLGFQAGFGVFLVAVLAVMSAHETAGIVLALSGGTLGMGIFMTLTLAAQSATMGGYQLLWLKLLRGQEMTLDDAKEVKPFILPLLGASLLCALGVIFGSLALVVPGVVLGLGFMLHPFFVLDKNLSAVEALKASWIASKGHKTNLFLLVLCMMIANTLGVMVCGLGLFISYPLSLGCLATYYHRIASPGNAYILDSEVPERTLEATLESPLLPHGSHVP